jgi:hypothetical protein
MNWFQKNFKSLIYVAFLVPILTVAFVSISHVTKWYGLSNPITWSIYLSVGIEIAALSALAAISAQMGRKVYFPFAIVTIIQFIGNIFFAYQFIDVNSQSFKDWIDLVDPLVSFMGVDSGDIVGHKRFLALFSGGMLPIISLSFLHMLVKFEEEDRKNKNTETLVLPENLDIEEISKVAGKMEAELEKEKYNPTKEELELLEQKLREINENKFKSLEVQEPVEDIVMEEKTIEIPQTVIDSPENLIVKEPEEIKNIPTVDGSKINRLSYINRNASNVSVQRI